MASRQRSARKASGLLGLVGIIGLGARGLIGAPSPAPLAVGYADADITPPLGTTMPGYFRLRRASGVLDALLAKALVLSEDDETIAIVALDLISVPAPIVAKIREAVRRVVGIRPDHVFVHATHTHTGATVSEIEERLPDQVARAVKEARERRVGETRVTYGTCPERGVAFIRRYLMRDGTVRTNPGRGNPAIVRPVGEIDPIVHAITFQGARTLVVSYGLHPDCIGGTRFSADYPHHLTEAVRGALGRDWNVLFLNACCGNVNHIDVKNESQRSGYETSRRIGRAIARAACAAHRSARTISIDRVAARAETVRCPLRKVPRELYEWAKRRMERNPKAASERRFNEPTPARIIALAEDRSGPHPAEIIALRIGPIGIVGLPAEAFVEVARDIRMHSLLEPTLVIGLTGGSMGYLPHPRGYREGGYEATFASARYGPETPRIWCDAAIRLLGALRAIGGE